MRIKLREITEEITREDMPNEIMRDIWDDFGKEVAVKLMDEYGGVPIVPPKRGFLKYVNRKINEEFTGDNYNELIRRYGVSRSHIYNIMNGK